MIRRLASTPVLVQVAALVLASIMAAQAIGFGIVVYAPPPGPSALSISEVLEFVATGVAPNDNLDSQIMSQPPFEMKSGNQLAPHALIRRSIAEALELPRDRVRVAMIEGYGVGPAGAGPTSTHAGIAVIPGPAGAGEARPGLGELLRSQTVTFPPFTTGIQAEDGSWLVITPRAGGLAAWQSRILLWFVISAALLAPLAWFIARLVTRPIRQFAEGVERFGLDPTAPPLEERGPREVRSAIQSFNRMQASLRAYVNERSAMVAAIAHDLRTPLTSLRFRAEAAPEAMRDRMVADIERMNAMTTQVMTFVRGEQKREIQQRLSLSLMAAQCAQEAMDGGAEVSHAIEPDIDVMGEPLNLRRALGNLVENAVKFGSSVHISVYRDAEHAVFQVDDKGPGLAEEELDKVFEPFHRAEPSRSRETGGMGLGLALVRTVVNAHGGDVSLSNRQPSGLSARVRLRLADRSG